ncbi:glycosyltransferase family 4 protein [Flavobacterium sp.]|uniref:glycosyltransferase family 4 protein n=1 Tax=Flavobacterium sp. TaxID=239 RepID=UPI00374C8A30
MLKNKQKIVIDIDRLKYPNTGMYNFCYNLYQNMSKSTLFDIYFYKHKKTLLEKGLKFININFLDTFFLKPKGKISLWHTTNQLTKRIPIRPIPLVYTIHDLNFLYSNKPQWKKNRELRKTQRNINRADYITFISNFTFLDVQKNLDITGKNYKIIYNGVQLDIFPEFDSPRIRPTEKFIFSLGVILPKKNFHTILPLLKDTNYSFVLSGNFADSNYKKFLLDEAKKLNVLDRFYLTGAIADEEKYWYLKHCEAFVFPSLSEGFGIPPIEAMRLGKPTFLSKLTSLPEIGGNLAYYFDNFEEEHMKSVLKSGLADYIDNNRKESIINWTSQFTWKKACESYLEVYKEVLEIS